MKYLDADRNPRAAWAFLQQTVRAATRPWALLEACGGRAQNLARFEAEDALPAGLKLIHGPGCPVCAAPPETFDRASALAGRPGVILCAPSDLMRVPGRRDSLMAARSRGGDVREVYTPLDALALARQNPGREVVVLAVGYETTAPAAAAAVREADRLGLDNFALMGAFRRQATAVEAALDSAGGRAQGVLVAGPVCAVTGFRAYEPIAAKFRVPVVITGPEPADLLDAIARAVRQLEAGTHEVENQYARAVRPEGNPHAGTAIAAVFETADADWPGLGQLTDSALVLREPFRRFDAADRYGPWPPVRPTVAGQECRDGEVFAGRIAPASCPAFGISCTTGHPLGTGMASPEGACQASYRYRRQSGPAAPLPVALISGPSQALPTSSR